MSRTTAVPRCAPATAAQTLPARQPGPARSPIRVVGIAADMIGWIGVELLDQQFVRAIHAGTLPGVITRMSGAAVITVGVPLGLPTTRQRRADTATSALPGRGPTAMLPAPPAIALTEATRTGAEKRCRHSGYALSRRAWLHRARILEANTVWKQHRRVLLEAHAELTYAHLSGTALTGAANSWRAQVARRQLLITHGIAVPDDLPDAATAGAVQVLDAATIAYTAHRVATGAAIAWPDPPETLHGSPVAIWT
jgi:predicted RNase H-like nuclease